MTHYRRWAGSAVAAVLLTAGCSREHFRKRADDDVQGVLTQKNVYPDWQVENWHVYPDPRARFADPSPPDFPPFPPDDPAAFALSPNPQRPGRGGAGRADGDGYLHYLTAADRLNRAGRYADTAEADVPGGQPADPAGAPAAGFGAVAGAAADYLRGLTPNPLGYRLGADQAVELALFNSREFQDRREDLYLAALPVTLERFGFAAQAFATERVVREATGSELPDGGGNRWRVDSDVGVRRRFASGAELIFQLASRVVVELGNGRPDVAVSTLGLSFVQPLLRGGGFAVALEPLTLAERTLLYAIRSYARFRRVFYVAVVGQGNYTNNPYGLQGLSANLGRGVGANLTANPVGFLPTVLRAATLENERKNVAALEQFLRLFENLREGGGVTELQVVRVEQNLLRSRSTVLNSTRQYLDNVDNFKLQLGVPATVPVDLDDAPLRPVRDQLAAIERVYADLRRVEAAAGRFDPAEPAAAYRGRWAELLTASSLARGTRFAEQYQRSADELRRLPVGDIDRRLRALADRRRRLLDARAERELTGRPDDPAEAAERAAVDAAADRLRFEVSLRQYEAEGWKRLPADRRAADQGVQFRAALDAGILVAVQARDERLAAARADFPKLPAAAVDGCDLAADGTLEEAYTRATEAALAGRLDLMNARAQVVDAWRQLTVTANALRGVLNVGYNLEANSPLGGNQPLLFAGSRTRHQLVIDVEPPFVRRDERNRYRAAVIAYQRQRRNLMAFEDNIATDARADVRLLRQLAANYDLQRRAVELAYAQVDNARSTFLAPPDPASARGAAGEAAALTQQLLEAQGSLVQAQNDLYTTWTNYLTARLDLYLDLERLPLDARGLFADAPPDPPQPPDPDPAARSGSEPLPEPRRDGV